MLIGLVNADGNYLVIETINAANISGKIYESYAHYDNLGPFDKTIAFNFSFGEDLVNAMKGTTALGTGGRSVYLNMEEAAQTLLIAKAAEDPTPYQVGEVNGEWVERTV